MKLSAETMALMTLIAVTLNSIALGFVIAQTYFSIKALDATKKSLDATRESLDAAKCSINDARKSRQIEMLPRAGWIITADVELMFWQKYLQDTSNQMKIAVKERNGDILERLSSSSPFRHPSDLCLGKFSRDKIPPWLCEVLISGAQYFYNAACLIDDLWSKENGPSFDLANSLIERFDESINALNTLRGMIVDLVPPVFQNAPARINEDEFFLRSRPTV